MIIGITLKDRSYEKSIKSQQERGDYWFNKYQAAIRYGENYPEDYNFFEDPNIHEDNYPEDEYP